MSQQGSPAEEVAGQTKRQDPARRSDYFGVIAVMLAAALATFLPVALWGTSCGHDFDFHMVSWMDAQASWRHGILYPHWTPDANFGAGEPRFVFYPPLTWMAGAALGFLRPWSAVPQVLAFLMLCGLGLATRALARRALPQTSAALAGCIAIFSGYTLFTLHERSAFAELGGSLWFPLLLLLALDGFRSADQQRPHPRPNLRVILLAFVIAGAWLTNAPVGVMASYLLAGIAIASALLERSWKPIMRAAAAAVLGIGLTAFYLVPAAREQRWVDIRQATDDPGLLIQNSFLFGHHASPLLKEHDQELARVSAIAVGMIAVSLAGIAVCWRRRTLPGSRQWWIPLALIPPAVLLLQLPVSLPLWNLLPKLRFLQFPWRWLSVVEAPLAVFVAAALAPRAVTRQAWRIPACALVFAGLACGAGYLFHQSCDDEDSVPAIVSTVQSGRGVEGTDEYAPPGADDSTVPVSLPAGCLTDDPAAELATAAPESAPVWSPAQHTCRAVFAWDRPNPEHRTLHGQTQAGGSLVLDLRRYPAWRITLNGRAADVIDSREDGLIVVTVPPGPITLQADWTTTPDVLLGRAISALAALVLLALGILHHRSRAAAQIK